MNSLMKYFICILDPTCTLGKSHSGGEFLFSYSIHLSIQKIFLQILCYIHEYLVKVLMNEVKNSPLENISPHCDQLQSVHNFPELIQLRMN